jgi:hypothetical protein
MVAVHDRAWNSIRALMIETSGLELALGQDAQFAQQALEVALGELSAPMAAEVTAAYHEPRQRTGTRSATGKSPTP